MSIKLNLLLLAHMADICVCFHRSNNRHHLLLRAVPEISLLSSQIGGKHIAAEVTVVTLPISHLWQHFSRDHAKEIKRLSFLVFCLIFAFLLCWGPAQLITVLKER